MCAPYPRPLYIDLGQHCCPYILCCNFTTHTTYSVAKISQVREWGGEARVPAPPVLFFLNKKNRGDFYIASARSDKTRGTFRYYFLGNIKICLICCSFLAAANALLKAMMTWNNHIHNPNVGQVFRLVALTC